MRRRCSWLHPRAAGHHPGARSTCSLLPPLLAKTVLRGFFIKMGFIRFFVLVTLIQFMAALPIKMVLRWTINLKYIVLHPGILLQHLT